ncbi:signal peptide peptidase SppA [Halovenus marina]|uniref:signal peptide peptidase SppA n=1 Tax=Halovenus marina TaxID=3396621 RepID=UPI003F56AA66
MRVLNTVSRVVVFAALAVAGIAGGWLLLVEFPESGRELLGIVLVVLAIPVVLRIAGTIANGLFPAYNVAEVGVEGPITRHQSGGPLARGPVGSDADAIVEQIERADEDTSVDALLVRLNTPGGEIVPSEDIKLAAERFDGPTVAYAVDTCASGGYEIASGCDEIWAREGSIVGSIGVIGSRVTAADLADRLGLTYEQFTAGEYKDAGTPLKELEPYEREYLQGIVDTYYDKFVESVAQRREMDAEAIRDTEARVYLGSQAHEEGLVDELGTREDVTEALEDTLDTQITIQEFKPAFGLTERLGRGSQRLAYAFGAGITGRLVDDKQGFEFR